MVSQTANSPVDVLRAVLNDPLATTPEKINAAKALDAIERKGGGSQDRLSRLTRQEIAEEIARVRALISVQAIDKSGVAAP